MYSSTISLASPSNSAMDGAPIRPLAPISWMISCMRWNIFGKPRRITQRGMTSGASVPYGVITALASLASMQALMVWTDNMISATMP